MLSLNEGWREWVVAEVVWSRADSEMLILSCTVMFLKGTKVGHVEMQQQYGRRSGRSTPSVSSLSLSLSSL